MLGSPDMTKSLVCPCQTIFDGNKVACVFTACWEEKNSFICLFILDMVRAQQGHGPNMMTNKIKRKRKRKRKRKKIYFGHIVQSQLLIKLTNHMGSCFSLSIKNLLSFSLDQPSHLCHWYFDRPVHLSSASIQAALTNP